MKTTATVTSNWKISILLITATVMYEGLGIRKTDLSTLLLFKDFPGLEKY